MTALGFCSTCGTELAAGETHAPTCAEDAFVFDDPEYARLSGSETDARDDYEIVQRKSRGGPAIARARARLDQCTERREAREAELRKEFQRRHGT